MSTPAISISKSSFLKFEQCVKSFYLSKYYPYLRDKLSVEKQLTFKRGNTIGILAQSLFPGGTDVSLTSKTNADAVKHTKQLIDSGAPVIYEATFQYQQALVMVDILVLEAGKYRAYEVKSSLKVSEVYIKDACYQYYVVKANLPDLEDFFLVSLNADYRLKGTLDLKQLFKKRSIKQAGEDNQQYFTHQLQKAAESLALAAVPEIEPGRQCYKPYACDYLGHCWKNAIGKDSVFDFPFVNREVMWEWYESGIKQISQLQPAQLTKKNLEHVRDSIVTQSPYSDKPALRDFIRPLAGKCIALDMEVMSSPVPKLQGTGPYFQIPFLASFSENNQHDSIFLHELSFESLEQFTQAFIERCKGYEHILVFDKNLERLVLQNLAEFYPALKNKLQEIDKRLVDISSPFKNFHYYHPAFKNSFSLKTLLQVLFPAAAYGEINSGLAAMDIYDEYLAEQNPIHKEMIKSKLIDYCETDAMASLLLLDFLKREAV